MRVRLHWEGQESAARAGLCLRAEDVTVCGEVIRVILHGVASPEPAPDRSVWSQAFRAPLESISQKVFIKLFRKSQFPHKFVNLFLIIHNVKEKLTDLCAD